MSHRRASSLRRAATAVTLALALVGGAPAGAAPTPVSPAGQDHGSPTRSEATLVPTLHPQSDAGPSTATGELETTPTTLAGTVAVPDGVTVVGLVWDGAPAELDEATGELVGTEASLRVRDGRGWADWESMGESVPVAEGGGWASEPVVVSDVEDVQVELTGDVRDARLVTWTSPVTPRDREKVAALPPVTEGDPMLAVGTRDDWGADDSARGGIWMGEPKLGVTLHHTVTPPVYAPEEVPATLRTIYAYHATTLGWGDIGYNMLVDQHGRLWEGRAGGLEQPVRGAHATGMNTDWFGLSVLGDHEVQPVAPGQHVSIAAPAAWVLNHYGADVGDTLSYTNPTYGWTRDLSTFHGHLDVAATLCPGLHLVAIMDQLRSRIATEQLVGRTAVQRIGGPDRYEVAARMAGEAFLQGTSVAYLTSGEVFADALGVGPVAHRDDAAVLLTKADFVPGVVMKRLAALGVEEVRLVGGEVAISPAVQDQLVAAGYAVTRTAGHNRYATAALLAQQDDEPEPSPEPEPQPGPGPLPIPAPGPEEERAPEPGGGTVYVANGIELADALGAAAAAAEVGAVVLLTTPDTLPSETEEELLRRAPSRVVVLGGDVAVSPEIEAAITALLPGAVVDRLGGANRYATNALIATDAFTESASAVVANAFASADAVVGTQLAAHHGGPVLLSRPGCRPKEVSAASEQLGVRLNRLAGGPMVLDWSAGSRTC